MENKNQKKIKLDIIKYQNNIKNINNLYQQLIFKKHKIILDLFNSFFNSKFFKISDIIFNDHKLYNNNFDTIVNNNIDKLNDIGFFINSAKQYNNIKYINDLLKLINYKLIIINEFDDFNVYQCVSSFKYNRNNS